MCIRMPQGYLASGNIYTWAYDVVIKDIPHKVKIVDDALCFDHIIEDVFYHVIKYLSHCAKNEIILNRDEFQFCQDPRYSSVWRSSNNISCKDPF